MKTEKIEKLLDEFDRVIKEFRLEAYNDEWLVELVDKTRIEARAELAALKSTAKDLECLLGEAQVENERLREWVKALVGLTPGGSEYVDDPARCVVFVRRKEEGLSKAMKRFKDRGDKIERETIARCVDRIESLKRQRLGLGYRSDETGVVILSNAAMALHAIKE